MFGNRQSYKVCNKPKNRQNSVIKYLSKKGMTSKEIYEGMVHILAVNFSAYTTVKKSAMKFK